MPLSYLLIRSWCCTLLHRTLSEHACNLPIYILCIFLQFGLFPICLAYFQIGWIWWEQIDTDMYIGINKLNSFLFLSKQNTQSRTRSFWLFAQKKYYIWSFHFQLFKNHQGYNIPFNCSRRSIDIRKAWGLNSLFPLPPQPVFWFILAFSSFDPLLESLSTCLWNVTRNFFVVTEERL